MECQSDTHWNSEFRHQIISIYHIHLFICTLLENQLCIQLTSIFRAWLIRATRLILAITLKWGSVFMILGWRESSSLTIPMISKIIDIGIYYLCIVFRFTDLIYTIKRHVVGWPFIKEDRNLNKRWEAIVLSNTSPPELLYPHWLLYTFMTVIHKVHIFWEGHKILQNLHLTFDCMYCSQKLGEDFAKFCGLLRIYELY